ncbi:hypothetical protein [Synechococcus sp. RSCCF101]|uniref:hypothetical protein n=1 Tax=Synechococcus sp. RSCCF101 TaxID=2511069 RepID=UPI001244ECC3|nr:hypothetical protein [Synechococcus sp. RSCCF101]
MHVVCPPAHNSGDRIMKSSMTLTLNDQFAIEQMSRAVESTDDLQAIKQLTQQLIRAWFLQRAATRWLIRQQL